jgi:hypothetical protein
VEAADRDLFGALDADDRTTMPPIAMGAVAELPPVVTPPTEHATVVPHGAGVGETDLDLHRAAAGRGAGRRRHENRSDHRAQVRAEPPSNEEYAPRVP